MTVVVSIYQYLLHNNYFRKCDNYYIIAFITDNYTWLMNQILEEMSCWLSFIRKLLLTCCLQQLLGLISNLRGWVFIKICTFKVFFFLLKLQVVFLNNTWTKIYIHGFSTVLWEVIYMQVLWAIRWRLKIL
jgi:ABC-type proline/glycine betaine transport system permease subunit